MEGPAPRGADRPTVPYDLFLRLLRRCGRAVSEDVAGDEARLDRGAGGEQIALQLQGFALQFRRATVDDEIDQVERQLHLTGLLQGARPSQQLGRAGERRHFLGDRAGA